MKTLDDFPPLEERLPETVTHEQILNRNKELWEPSWGREVGQESDQNERGNKQ
jgi:hypothetical protein